MEERKVSEGISLLCRESFRAAGGRSVYTIRARHESRLQNTREEMNSSCHDSYNCSLRGERMKILDILLWGLLATGLLTTLLRAGQALHLTRMDMPFLLGTMVTPNRDRAKVIGFVIHFFNGWWIALLYAAFFHGFGYATWWLGGLMGLAHAAFVLIVVLPLLPGGYPRMASDFKG